MNFNRAEYTASYGTLEQLPASTRLEFAFVGRSNVGKSSLLNKLLNRKSLAKVSQTPGKTATINFYRVDTIDFVDLPGYGFAKANKQDKARWAQMIEGYFDQDRRFALVVALIDIRHEASDLDLHMIEFLAEHDLPFALVFTKADKLSKAQQDVSIRRLCTKFATIADMPVFVCSSLKGTGIDDLRSYISEIAREA